MRKTRFTAAFLAVLLAVFGALSFAGEATAKPNWVTVRAKAFTFCETL